MRKVGDRNGKGRKDRVVPLWKITATKLRAWQARIDPTADASVFPNRHGQALSRSGVEHRLRIAVAAAANGARPWLAAVSHPNVLADADSRITNSHTFSRSPASSM